MAPIHMTTPIGWLLAPPTDLVHHLYSQVQRCMLHSKYGQVHNVGVHVCTLRALDKTGL